jgi:MOSC domain-containing protein YiiM
MTEGRQGVMAQIIRSGRIRAGDAMRPLTEARAKG